MRGKRSKQYRKLMQQYGISFAFREPYQVLVDAEIIQDAARFTMDLMGGLERTLHGKVKPMITQCSMRHLYTASPPIPHLVEQAKAYERRRCNHHTLDEPLSTVECISSVVDPKSSKTNKHRYVVASQSEELRSLMRTIPGVPLVYINRSVMIMEPMATVSADVRIREERGKFRDGLKRRKDGAGVAKRRREDDDNGEGVSDATGKKADGSMGDDRPKSKKQRGPKGPNPLSVKKPQKKTPAEQLHDSRRHGTKEKPPSEPSRRSALTDSHNESEPAVKRKRKRKHGAHGTSGDAHSMDLLTSTVED